MVHPWQWLLITNLKVLVEEEGEITIREVMEDIEVEEISLLALVVTILIQMEVSIAICLNLIRVASPDLQGFKVKLNDHNIRFLEIMDIVANSSQVHVANGWLTDTGCLDHVTPNLANISLQQQRTLGSRTMTVLLMVKNYLLLILAMVSCVLPLIILGLMVYLEIMILHPICYLFISFVCKTIPYAILMLIDFLFRIYLQGRSFTKD